MDTFQMNPLLFEDHVDDNAFFGLLHGGIMPTTVIDHSMYLYQIISMYSFPQTICEI